MRELQTIVMAAGRGTRMRSAIPKVLHSVAGVPMVGHVLRAVRRVDASKVWVVVPSAPLGQEVQSLLDDDVECIEQPDPLGTGHALTTALSSIAGNPDCLLVLNGDLPLIKSDSLRALVRQHTTSGATLSLLVASLDAGEASDMGQLLRDDSRQPSAIVEAGEAGLPPQGRRSSGVIEANVGVYCIEAKWLRGAVARLSTHATGETYITDLVAVARHEGFMVQAVEVGSAVEAIGVNSRYHLAQAESAMQQRLRAYWMDQGVTLEDPATTYLHTDIELDEEVIIRPNTSLQGHTRVGRGAEIGPNAQLIDTLVAPGCTVGSSVLSGVVMEAEASVGPYCHLRPGTCLGRNVFVGSHVEMKDSRIGESSHVGHFSYVGDAQVGPRVNIGAGTVTCNFDGVEKHVTEIDEGAFIGSDTLLVAPVRVGARAVTGAGAVVIHDVPIGATVAGVPARLLERRRLSAIEIGTSKEE